MGSSDASVMSHAYIAGASAANESAFNELIKRFDFFAQDSSVVNVIGMNNGSSGTIPPIFGSTYNSISVGRTDGAHSHGLTPVNYPGPGRQKPDIVSTSSVNATSYATGVVSSAASLLIAKAETSGNADAKHPDTIKACLLAGATKGEFPSWSQTSAKPLDTTYGVGELNIFYSYRIIEKAESSTGNVFYRGWSRQSVNTAQSRIYTFTTPNYQELKLSAVLIWQRDVTESGGSPKIYTYQSLANLKLELLDVSNAVIQISDSALDNVEHVWNTSLEPNTTYKLKVTSSSGTSDFSLAWRVDGVADVVIETQVTGADVALSLSGLYSGTTYTIRCSSDLVNWTDVHQFSATGTTDNWTDTGALAAGTRVFYRVFFFEP